MRNRKPATTALATPEKDTLITKPRLLFRKVRKKLGHSAFFYRHSTPLECWMFIAYMNLTN